MAKQTDNGESFVDLQFPLNGIDKTAEFELQRQGTTVEGVNVRGCESMTFRDRGGSRAGLGRYINHTVGVLDADGNDAPGKVIQHLAIIVDPTIEGLLSDDEDDGEINDPSTSNRVRRRIPLDRTRRVRKRGSGRQTNRLQPRLGLTITANNQTKFQGDLFVFAGTEFTVSGLEILDTVVSCTITSAGTPVSAPEGSFPINISNAKGRVLGGPLTASNKQLAKKYRIKYVKGVMTDRYASDHFFVFDVFGTPSNPAITLTIDYRFDGATKATIAMPAEAPMNAVWAYKTALTGGPTPLVLVPVPTSISSGGTNLGNSATPRPSSGSHTLDMKITWTSNGVLTVGTGCDAAVYKVDRLTGTANLVASNTFTQVLSSAGGTIFTTPTTFTLEV